MQSSPRHRRMHVANFDISLFFCVESGLQGDAPDVGMLGWQHQEGQRRRQDRIVGHAKARLGWSMGLAASRTPPSASMLHNVRVSVCMGSCCTCNAVLKRPQLAQKCIYLDATILADWQCTGELRSACQEESCQSVCNILYITSRVYKQLWSLCHTILVMPAACPALTGSILAAELLA